MDWKVGRLWTSERAEPDQDFKVFINPHYERTQVAIKSGYAQMNLTIDKLKNLYSSKVFKHIILPVRYEDHYFQYLIL